MAALTLTSYGIAQGYSFALLANMGNTIFSAGFRSAYLLPLASGTGYLLPALKASFGGSHLYKLNTNALNQSPVDAASQPTQNTSGVLRYGTVIYSSMGNGGFGGITTLTESGTNPNGLFDIAKYPTTVGFTGYFPTQLVQNGPLVYQAVNYGNSAQGGATPTTIQVMQVNPSITDPLLSWSVFLEPYPSPILANSIPGFTDARSSKMTSIAFSQTGDTIYLAISSNGGAGAPSRILGYTTATKVKVLDILVSDDVSGLVTGTGSLAGKLIIFRAGGVDEYTIATNTTNNVISGGTNQAGTPSCAAFGTVNSYFYNQGTSGSPLFTLGMFQLTSPAAVFSNGTGQVTPVPPTNLAWAGCQGAQNTLTWTASAVTSYRITRNGALIGSTPAFFFVDATAQQGVTYTYAVYGVTMDGTLSTPVSITVTTCAATGHETRVCPGSPVTVRTCPGAPVTQRICP